MIPPLTIGRGIKKQPKIKKISIGEETLAQQLKSYKIPFLREYKFHPDRKWKFDFVITEKDMGDGNIIFIYPYIAIEVEGGVWAAKSRHRTGKGFLDDMEKYNAAAILRWRVLRFSTEQISSGYAIDYIRKALA